MHIVAHNASPVLGGGEIWTARLLAGLQARGHRVLMLCRNAPMAARAAEHGIPARVLALGGDAMLPDALRFAWALRRCRADAVLLTTFKKTWLGGLGARLARVPRVVARVAIAGMAPRNFTYRAAMLHFVDAVAVNSDELRGPFLAALPRLDPRRLLTIHDGVPEPARQAAPGTLRRELGLQPGCPVIGTLARLTPQKRLDRLLEALVLLPPDVHCVIAGEGSERAALEALAGRLGVADRVHLTGFRPDIGDVLDALDVFVLSSDREGMANAMLEALWARVPVVSTAVSGAAEALEPLEDGALPGLVVGFDAQALADALRGLLADPRGMAQMAQAGRRRAEARFGSQLMLDRWEALLMAGGSGLQ